MIWENDEAKVSKHSFFIRYYNEYMIVKCLNKALSFYSVEPLYKALLEFIKCFVLKTLYFKTNYVS